MIFTAAYPPGALKNGTDADKNDAEERLRKSKEFRLLFKESGLFLAKESRKQMVRTRYLFLS
jgi:hypothetical protein